MTAEFDVNNFDALRISLASAEDVRGWSRGEVKKPETINYRTLKPEKDGLYCEKIFGPTKDWECACGKYKRVRFKGIVCERCGVEVTRSKVRRERMGHIELAAPVSHIWYFKGIPSRMGTLLKMSPRAMEQILYYASYIVLDPGTTPLEKHQILTESEYQEKVREYGKSEFRVGIGAEAVREMLREIDLDALAEELRAELDKISKKASGREVDSQKKQQIVKRLEVVEAFRTSGNKPEWMILDAVPVIPPELRPMVQLDGGRFATADLNDLYRRVINRNDRLKRMLAMGAPEIITRNEKRMLQEAVDALIDNGRRGRPVTGAGGRTLKSLSDLLRGKQGRFRQNLLGKRVDYSGRSVIVVGPELKLHQCGLPKEMALELFKPFVIEKLVNQGLAVNVKTAKRSVERLRPEVWDVLEEVITDHPVLLNRAPTLHRLGIQAFEPVLVEGKALKLHPLCCTAFNADFDGDQMAVHVPLSMEAQAEARFLMLAANNILKPQDGKPVVCPTQDMVMGCYYLTILRDGAKGEGKIFTDVDEAKMAYDVGELSLQAVCRIRLKRTFEGKEYTKLVETTIGRIIFNEAIPQDLGNQPRTCPDDMFKLEIDEVVGKKQLARIIDDCYRIHGVTETSLMLDRVKAMGYKYSTIGAVTVSVADIKVPAAKKTIISETENKVHEIERQFRRGRMSENERYLNVTNLWEQATKDITNEVMLSLDKFNPINMMATSGARGSTNQIRQLAGMRGLMASPSGKIIELPIKSNFREGLSVLEFFLSSHGSRKSLADTALRTADSGYMTRRLVDVSQENIIRETDCFEKRGLNVGGLYVSDITKAEGTVIENLEDRIRGRVAAEDVVDPESGEVYAKLNELITHDIAKKIVKAGIKSVKIRSVLTCQCDTGICARCYGADMSNSAMVEVGEAVGVIAAQAIGEPGTQLTMRTFHTGGVASGEDITQGLPRVEELFEARKPKKEAVLAEISGYVHLPQDNKKKREIVITGTDADTDVKRYPINYGSKLKVKEGDYVNAGDELIEGSINPHELLRILGHKAVQDYIVREVESVYRDQGVEIADKHIEVIVRQMLRKVRIEESNDTNLLPGSLVDIYQFEQENRKTFEAGGHPATARRVLLGITKAALATDSFLSAASFQETTRVLTEAAIKGKTDPLLGLKENVILGKLIPAGTGMRKYASIEVKENV